MSFKLLLPALLLAALSALAQDARPAAPAANLAGQSIVVASTTSTQDSGLFTHLLPLFTQRTGIQVRVVAQGTGQALDTARRGDADVVFLHARQLEEQFVEQGFGVRRFEVMYNDFVLIGPRSDPAGIRGTNDMIAALTRVREREAPFVSRGDRSGTHTAELALWREAGIDVGGQPDAWYRAIGQGMGAALNTAAAMNAYVLADRGTWLAFQNRQELEISVEGDGRLVNQYGVILVNPERHRHVKREAGQAFVDWIISQDGQAAIASYRVSGQQLFFPNATTPRS